jgi:hypothetical protein
MNAKSDMIDIEFKTVFFNFFIDWASSFRCDTNSINLLTFFK